MKKKALILASVASMIDQFNMSNIKILQSLDYDVDVVADFTTPGTITIERSDNLKKRLFSLGVRVFDVEIPRSLNIKAITFAYKKVKKLINAEHYSILHCHSPIGGAIARLAAKEERKNNELKVLYTAHGFHFYTGAPLINWLFFYPIEKWLCRYTDILITINKEDYNRAKNKFKIKEIVYVPGVGIDTNIFAYSKSSGMRIRDEFGLDENKIILLSVGELNANKNHAAVIKAIKGMNITYIIVGQGEKKDELRNYAAKLGEDVRLVGYRTDVADFYNAADVFILPSLREGLNVSLMEAMSCGVACTCSNIRGNTDLIDYPLFNPTNTEEIRAAISDAINNKENLGIKCHDIIQALDISNIEAMMKSIYMKNCMDMDFRDD